MKPDKVLRIKQLLEHGQYHIDPYAIADAIIRWAGLAHEVPPRPASQKEWSKPASGPSAPKKLSSPVPAKTDPIQVRPAFAAGEL
jgi:anti-sigma-28 factor FlgM